MITQEPTNRDLEADAQLVARYLRRGLAPDEGEQLAMLFRDSAYRDAVYRRAAALEAQNRHDQ